MKVVAVVAEKPSVMQALASALGGCGAEFEGRFLGERVWYRLAATKGHLFALDFVEAYDDWEAVEPRELFEAPLRLRPAGPVAEVREACQEADDVVLCLDDDAEGDAICAEVADLCCREKKTRLYRARFSATTKADVERAFRNLGEPDWNAAEGVAARQELDLRVGVAFTRFLTTHFRQKFAGLDSSTLSFGPCQTPTLGFVVRRQDEITHFVAEDYWVLSAESADLDDGGGLRWVRRKCFDFDLAAEMARFGDVANGEEYGVVEEAETSSVSTRAPPGLSTVDLLKLGSRLLRLSPKETMRLAEKLYLEGLISYPRTETTRYPASFDLQGTLRAQLDDPRWPDGLVAELLADEEHRGAVTRRLAEGNTGVDAGDHPPVTPTTVVSPGSAAAYYSSGPAARVYELITRRFLASLCGPATSETASLRLRHEPTGELFDVSRTAEVEPGFRRAFWRRDESPSSSSSSSSSLAEVARFRELFPRGRKVSLRVAKTPTKRQTVAPSLLTEAECVELMEKHRIGTDASISAHLSVVCERGYVLVDRTSRRLEATQLGVALYRGLSRVDDDLVRPHVRAQIEDLCALVSKGVADRRDVVEFALEHFCRKFDYLVQQVASIDQLFEALFDDRPADQQQTLVDEPRFCLDGESNHYFGLVKRRKPARLVNTHTFDVVALPQGGDYTASSGVPCPTCRSEAVWFRLHDLNASKHAPQRRKTITFPLCPRCFDRHDDETAKKKKPLYDECPLPDAHPLVQKYLVSEGGLDTPSSSGVKKKKGCVILEPASSTTPKLLTTRHPIFVGVFASIVKTARLQGDRLLEITFAEGDSPLDDGALVCRRTLDDPLVRSLIAVAPAKLASPPPPPKNGKGRRR